MKKYILLTLSLLMLLPIMTGCGRKKLDEPIELIIANDIHYISPTLVDYTAYDIVGEVHPISRDGKIVHYIPEITDAFLAEVIEKRPKALILAGDLTMNGALVSHEELVKKLEAVKDTGVDVLIIPGNHDVDKTAVDYSGEELKEAPAADSAKYIELYEPLMPQTVSRDESSQSFVYEASRELWVLMLDTNTYGQNYVKDTTLAWVEEQLSEARSKNIDVIAVSHQNLYAHSTMLSFGYRLYNADKLLELYEKYEVRCNFSGHIHIQSIIDDAKVPEIVTSSMAITGTHYGKIVYNGKQIDYSAESVNVSAYAQNQSWDNPDMIDFAKYAEDYFKLCARLQVSADGDISKEKYTPSEITVMKDTYAEINTAYFEGRPIDEKAHKDGVSLWRLDKDSFVAKYIDSMLETGKKDHRSIKIKLK